MFARDIKFDLQYLTLDQISVCSYWSGLLSFGVSTDLVKVKRRVSNLRLAKQKQHAIRMMVNYVNSCPLICDDVYSGRWVPVFLETSCFRQQATKMFVLSRRSRKRPFRNVGVYLPAI